METSTILQGLPPPPMPKSARPLRTRGAILTLALLSPLTAEVLTGSTPILLFLFPTTLLYQVLFYGSGALLIREAVRRRGLGWPSIVLLGAAYGILEEGLVNVTWFNPFWPDVLSYHGYGRALGLNWVWALSLTAFHAIVSITIPILLVELLFPKQATLPWLGRKGRWGFGIALALASALGLWVLGFLLFRKQGFVGPPLVPYLGTLVLAIGLVLLGLRLAPSGLMPDSRLLHSLLSFPTAQPVPPGPLSIGDGEGETARQDTVASRRPPRLWVLRIFGFVAIFFYFAAEPVLQPWAPFAVAFVIFAMVLVLIAWRVRSWSRRAGWSARHMLALASGVLGLFILVFAPLEELAGATTGGKPAHGQILVALAFLILLIVLARRLAPSGLMPDSRLLHSLSSFPTAQPVPPGPIPIGDGEGGTKRRDTEGTEIPRMATETS